MLFVYKSNEREGGIAFGTFSKDSYAYLHIIYRNGFYNCITQAKLLYVN